MLSFCPKLVAVLFTTAVAFCSIDIRAQPLREPAPQDSPPPDPPAAEERAVPAEPVRPAEPDGRSEPGYLGMIGDDRGEQGRGVRIRQVVEGSPAAAAGLRVNDLIVGVDGEAARSVDELTRVLETLRAGDKLTFDVVRDGRQRTAEVTLGRRPPPGQRPFAFGRIPERAGEDARRTERPPLPEGVAMPRGQLLGIRTAPVTEAIVRSLRLPAAGGALVVSRVVGSPADRADIPLDAVIVAVDDQPIASPNDLVRAITAAGPGKEVEITYYHQGKEHTVAVQLGREPLPIAAERRPPLEGIGPVPGPLPPEPPIDDRDNRIAELERRVRELEDRLVELERGLSGKRVEK